MSTLNILILGASSGSLFSTKAALAGHNTCMVCLPDEQELINDQGTIVRIPMGRLEIQFGTVETNRAAQQLAHRTDDGLAPL